MAWPKGVPHTADMIAKRLAKVTGVLRGPTSEITRERIREGHRRRLAKLPPLRRRPTAKYRQIVEDYLNIVLPSKILVHHINEDPKDNRLENLAVMPRLLHTSLHVCLRFGLKVDVSKYSVIAIKEQHAGAATDLLSS